MRGIVASLLIAVGVFFLMSGVVWGQAIHQDVQEIVEARVLEVLSEREETIPGTDVRTTVQQLRAEILSGQQEGQEVIFRNDYTVLDVGDPFFLNVFKTIDGDVLYSVSEPDRRNILIGFTLLFVFVTILFGKKQGALSLIALCLSFLLIIFGLLPALLRGAPPIPVSIGFAIGILTVVMFVTHGFNRMTFAALLGTVCSIIFTGILAVVAVDAGQLFGFTSDEAIYLNLDTGGELDLRGLLLGGIIIGVLGLLDDVAITQTAAVAEFRSAGLSKKEAYTRAMRIGREHVGALVNTLALAYTGAALPLLLLFSLATADPSFLINKEIFATEILRTIVGSIGLVLTVPFATLTGLALYKVEGPDDTQTTIHRH